MREELMTAALCLQMGAKVAAGFAHTRQNWRYYCPEECLIKVRAAQKKNVYFYAPDRHRPGCKNETEVKEPPPKPGQSKPRESTAPVLVPTHLGPPQRVQSEEEPTEEQLLELARKVKDDEIQYPGTLEDVVTALFKMTERERSEHYLSIGSHRRKYSDAFCFLPGVDDDVAQLPCEHKIIFGAAKVRRWGNYYHVYTKRNFSYQGNSLPIHWSTSIEKPCLKCLPELVGQDATLFWHGNIPKLAPDERYFVIKSDPNLPYKGAALRLGLLTPRSGPQLFRNNAAGRFWFFAYDAASAGRGQMIQEWPALRLDPFLGRCGQSLA